MSMAGEVADVDGYSQPASSSSSEVSMSSSPDLTKCFECESTPSVFFCLRCNSSLCAECDTKKVHNSRTTGRHTRMRLNEYLIVDRSLGKAAPTEDEMNLDEGNKLLFFSPVDNRIQLLPRLGSLVTDPDARPSLVAFIGPTGVGKSTLMRILISLNAPSDDSVKDAGPMPLAGSPEGDRSTSADIHMYAGRQVVRYADDELRSAGCQLSEIQSSTVVSTHPLLYLDSEGTGGSKEPISTRNMWNKGRILFGHTDVSDDFFEKRFTHVQISYPRMLYLFSDVLCFVFKGSPRERESIMKPLLEWGRSGAAGAANRHRPRLIIIFNMASEAKESQFNDSRKTYQKWLEGDKNVGKSRDKLEDYYSDPQVFLIPSSESNAATVLDRVKMLSTEILNSTENIRKSREQTNQLFTRRQLQQYMQLAANTFSKDPSGEFDIYRESMALRPISGKLEWYIVEFRREVEHSNPGSKLTSYKESLNVLQERIGVAVLLWIARLNVDIPVGANAQLPKDLRKALELAQTTIDGEEPCASVSNRGLPCDTIRRMHEGMHVSGKIRDKEAQQWEGNFKPDDEVQMAVKDCRLVDLAKRALRNTTTLDVTKIRSFLSKALMSESADYPWLKSSPFYRVCVICMVELPTEMLSCGHIICAMCAKEVNVTEPRSSKVIDLTCPVCFSPSKWCPKDLPPLAGYRILSLDGGGVRGIVELLALQEIMTYFPTMHVDDLFDMIVGTSTGGIIALALTVHKLNEEPMRLPKVIELFEKLSTEVFSAQMLRPGASVPIILRCCQFLRIYDTKYKNDNLLMFLKDRFGEQSLLSSCVGGPHVIVTSCDRDNVSAAWFTSYNRRSLEKECDNLFQQANPGKDEQGSPNLPSGRVSDPHLFSPKDAAAATSAAGTYFPAYEAGKRFWIDGGLRFNGPALIGIQEARIVWPKRGTSALISLGCGELIHDEGSRPSDSLIKFLHLVVNVVTDAETQIRDAINLLNQLQPGSCSLRLNPIITVPRGEKCELDNASMIPYLKMSTMTYLRETPEGRVKVQDAANILFANLFYLAVDIDEGSRGPITMCIRSRTTLPKCLRDALITDNESSPSFSVTVREEVGAESEIFWALCTWDPNGLMTLPFRLNGLPLARPLTVMIELRKFFPKTVASKELLPISGMPYSLA